jgi:hypothetical protein
MSAKSRRQNHGQASPVPRAQPPQGQSQSPAALEYRLQRLLEQLQERETRSQAILARLELKEKELDAKIREVNSIQSGLRRDIMAGNEVLMAFKVALQAFAKQEVNMLLEAAARDAIDEFTEEMQGRVKETGDAIIKQFDSMKMVLMGVVDLKGKVRPNAITIPDAVAGLFIEVEEVRRRGHV